MATVTYGGTQTYTCTTAIKGTDYIHLLDASGNMITTFDGITNFSAYTITGGSWTSPANASSCSVAVVHEDGTVGPSGTTTNAFMCSNTAFPGPMVLGSNNYGSSLPASGTTGQVFFKLT